MKSPRHHPAQLRSSLSLMLGVMALLAGPLAEGSTPSGGRRGMGTPGYVWNGGRGERLAALRKQGDARRGAALYAACASCHDKKGGGLAHGWLPRIAGQHASVLVKQLADIRSGLRDNPAMYPVAATLIDAQELADVAAYVETLRGPTDVGTGRGVALARGEELYQRDCAKCHGARGEGDAGRLFPRVGGQHFLYLQRQATLVRDGGRRNAHPEMLRAIAPYTDADLEAVCDWLSRQPGAQAR